MSKKVRCGTIKEITAIHYGHLNTLSRRGGAGYYRRAKTSLWATVQVPQGATFKVWLCKRPGIPGVPVERQEQELRDEMLHLVGKEIEFTQSRRHNNTCFATKDFLSEQAQLNGTVVCNNV